MIVARNNLLLSFLAALFAFPVLGYVAEHPWVAFIGASGQLVGGAIACWFYSFDAAKAVANPSFRNPDSPNSHHLVLGVALLGWGHVYSGMASIIFIANGSPQDWLSSYWFYGGRYITMGGFYHIYKAIREEPRAVLSFKPSLTVIIAALMFGLAMFLLGLRIGPHAPSAFEGAVYQGAATYPRCRENEEIWVSSSGLYHAPDSPDRMKILGPRRCFTSERAAETAGFHKAYR